MGAEMSGGHYSYCERRLQYQFIDQAEQDIALGNLEPDEAEALRAIINHVRVTIELVRCADYRMSGDYGRESFFDALRKAKPENERNKE